MVEACETFERDGDESILKDSTEFTLGFGDGAKIEEALGLTLKSDRFVSSDLMETSLGLDDDDAIELPALLPFCLLEDISKRSGVMVLLLRLEKKDVKLVKKIPITSVTLKTHL